MKKNFYIDLHHHTIKISQSKNLSGKTTNYLVKLKYDFSKLRKIIKLKNFNF